MVCDKENGVCDKVLCERSCMCVCESCVWKMVCGKRTMCRVPRCRAETSKHVTYSCDCTRRKVHCWIRKCEPAQNMNWVQARHWHFCLASDFFPRWVKIKTRHASSWSDDRRTPMKGECHQVPGRRHRRPSAPKRATRARRATQNEGGCHQVPRLPRETKVDVAKCHACHAKWGGVTSDQACPSAPKRPTGASPVP